MKIDDKILNGTHGYTDEKEYIPPAEEIQRRLSWFSDQKFALMVHFGLYNQLGECASWGLSDYDADWSRRGVTWAKDGQDYREKYFGLKHSFAPICLCAEEWAKMARESGFRYLIFTTKHHDGFCMWDSKFTDFKTTAPDCPFHSNENADIVKAVFDAFRKEGLGIGAYFSKPDWHCPYYWAPGMPHSQPTWRFPSYDPDLHPTLWETFVQYTQNQILELIENYGKIDILWLDGGQVNPKNGLNIRLGEVVAKARAVQPDLIVVDRTVGGEYENYLTPEQTVPDRPIFVPWESCLTLGDDFSYCYADHYKSHWEVIQTLIEIVCKGGNLALNISPQPDGRFPKQAISVMQKVGKWLEKYGEAIYGTRVCAPYKKGNVSFTQKGNAVYAFVTRFEQQPSVHIPYTGRIGAAFCMNTGKDVRFSQDAHGVMLYQQLLPDETVYVFRLERDSMSGSH